MNWQSDLFRRVTAMLLILVVGSVVALCCVGGNVELWVSSLGLVPWMLALATMSRLLMALVLAVTLVAFIRPILPQALGGMAFWLGKALAFFPVNILVWSFLGWWIGSLGHPIWTLMPVAEPESTLSMFEAWARWAWTWIPVVGFVSLPLTGQCLSLCFENDARSRDVGIDLLGLFAMALIICVEDIFAIQGAATHLTAALRVSDVMNLAASVWMLTSISLLLTAILSMSQAWAPERMDSRRWVKLLLGSILKISAWCLSGCIILPSLWTDSQGRFGVPGLLRAFDDPMAMFYLGLPWTLGALLLWALGRFVQPR